MLRQVGIEHLLRSDCGRVYHFELLDSFLFLVSHFALFNNLLNSVVHSDLDHIEEVKVVLLHSEDRKHLLLVPVVFLHYESMDQL